jgi:ribonuclease D
VDTVEGLEALGARLCAVPRLALDTEANSLHAYRERTCVVQISTDAESAIVDPLALPSLAPLRDALDRPDVEVVFHGGDYDITVLTRDHGFSFARVFDTHIAATLLGEPRVGLADLVGTAFGVRLDKRFQTADWAQRPLTAAHLAYLQNDTQHLLALRDLLAPRLAERDLEEEAAIEFRRLARRRGRPLAADPEGWRRVKGSATLGPIQRAVLHELWAWREAEAERRDVPPFKVLGPQSLLAVAQHAREAADPRAPLIGVSPREAVRYARDLREAAQRGLAAEREGRGPGAEERPSLTEEQRRAVKVRTQRETVLRNWRRDEAAARGVPNVVVLPNPALEWLAERGTVSAAELAAHPDVGAKRAGRYGEALLRALASVNAPAATPPAHG